MAEEVKIINHQTALFRITLLMHSSQHEDGARKSALNIVC